MIQKKLELKYRAYKFSIEIINFCQNLPNKGAYRIIMDQLVRSVTSIGANIIEAKAASSRRDFAKFFQIVLKSANEAQYWLCLLRDSGFEVDREKVKELLAELKEICSILAKSIITIKEKYR